MGSNRQGALAGARAGPGLISSLAPHTRSLPGQARRGWAKNSLEQGSREGGTTVQSYGLTPHWSLQRALAQMDDLRLVSVLEICVDTREHSLGNFGKSPHCPHPPRSGQAGHTAWA